MIQRTILKQIDEAIKSKPVTLITGARQVGKSTLAELYIEKGFSYISLDSMSERMLAKQDPHLFLSLHPFPLIIDEVQKAPELFEVIEEIVNKEKMKRKDNYGMYILTGSQIYRLMNKVSESLAGRVAIIHMFPLSRNEIISRKEIPFAFNLRNINSRAKHNPLSPLDLYNLIVKGFYPELYSNSALKINQFYSDYVESYLEKDVSELIHVKDKFVFRRFLELIASLTGQELVYDSIAKALGVDIKTIQSWISILLAGDIIYLLEPFNELSMTKRLVKRPKLYFNDTGLACFLAHLDSPETLRASIFGGHFVETYIINELRKSFINNGESVGYYYYRDSNNNEIDLVLLHKGTLHRIECKSGMQYNLSSVRSFKQLDNTKYTLGTSGIICNSDVIYPLDKDIYVFPLSGI